MIVSNVIIVLLRTKKMILRGWSLKNTVSFAENIRLTKRLSNLLIGGVFSIKNRSKEFKKSNLFLETIKEFSKITWPRGKEFKSTSITVLVFVGLYIIYIGFFDFILKKCFDILFR